MKYALIFLILSILLFILFSAAQLGAPKDNNYKNLTGLFFVTTLISLGWVLISFVLTNF